MVTIHKLRPTQTRRASLLLLFSLAVGCADEGDRSAPTRTEDDSESAKPSETAAADSSSRKPTKRDASDDCATCKKDAAAADGSTLAPDRSESKDGGARGAVDGRVVDANVRTDASSDTNGADAGSMGDAGSNAAMCEQTMKLAPGETRRTLQFDGVARSYLLHVPASYTGKEPVPLVLDWHGILLDGSTQRGLSGYAELSDKEGFIVAFPNGIDNAWNVGPCCTSSREVDDVGFARALVAEISKLACIEPKRVYSTGFSMGGGMSHYLACQATDLFAAVAPAAFDLLAADEQTCKPSRPITVITFRGKDDFIVPYEGGASNPPNGLPITIHFRGAQATFAFWREANGCTGTPTKSNGCETYANCQGGVQATLCTTQGAGGHTPGDAELGWSTMKQYTLP